MSTRLDAPIQPSNNVGWRRWSPADIALMARAASIKGCNLRDANGAALGPVPELDIIRSAVVGYAWFLEHRSGLADELRAAVCARIASQCEAAVGALRVRGLDLFWRHEPTAAHEDGELVLAFTVGRI